MEGSEDDDIDGLEKGVPQDYMERETAALTYYQGELREQGIEGMNPLIRRCSSTLYIDDSMVLPTVYWVGCELFNYLTELNRWPLLQPVML